MTISSDVTISGNGHAVTLDGGGNTQLMNIAVNLTVHLDQLTFAHGSSSSGAGISISGSTVTVSNSTFFQNIASSVVFTTTGGAISALTVIGGATTYASHLTVTNSTFDGNSAAEGSAISAAGTTSVVNSTFVGNSHSALLAAGTFTLTNTIVAQSGSADCSGTITDGGGNLADDATCAFTSSTSRDSVSDASLAVAALADNGGPTQTNALQAGSLAIDFTSGCLSTDQRGVSRYDNAEATCNAGAYEYQDPAPSPTPTVAPTPTPTPTPVPVPTTGGDDPMSLLPGAVMLALGTALAGGGVLVLRDRRR